MRVLFIAFSFVTYVQFINTADTENITSSTALQAQTQLEEILFAVEEASLSSNKPEIYYIQYAWLLLDQKAAEAEVAVIAAKNDAAREIIATEAYYASLPLEDALAEYINACGKSGADALAFINQMHSDYITTKGTKEESGYLIKSGRAMVSLQVKIGQLEQQKIEAVRKKHEEGSLRHFIFKKRFEHEKKEQRRWSISSVALPEKQVIPVRGSSSFPSSPQRDASNDVSSSSMGLSKEVLVQKLLNPTLSKQSRFEKVGFFVDEEDEAIRSQSARVIGSPKHEDPSLERHASWSSLVSKIKKKS